MFPNVYLVCRCQNSQKQNFHFREKNNNLSTLFATTCPQLPSLQNAISRQANLTCPHASQLIICHCKENFTEYKVATSNQTSTSVNTVFVCLCHCLVYKLTCSDIEQQDCPASGMQQEIVPFNSFLQCMQLLICLPPSSNVVPEGFFSRKCVFL